MFDEQYVEKLRDYANQRIREEGSARSWGKKMGLDRDTLLGWLRGQLTEPIRLKSLIALARDRNETPEETRDWLEGKPSLLEQVRNAPPHIQTKLLLELTYQQYRLLQSQTKNGELSLVPSVADSCNLSLDKKTQEERMSDLGKNDVLIGAKRHFKLAAILKETLRIRNIDATDIAGVALAMGYRRGTFAYGKAMEMLTLLLLSGERTLDVIGYRHIGRLAQFCYRVTRFDFVDHTWLANCNPEQAYGNDTIQLLDDINCENGAVVS